MVGGSCDPGNCDWGVALIIISKHGPHLYQQCGFGRFGSPRRLWGESKWTTARMSPSLESHSFSTVSSTRHDSASSLQSPIPPPSLHRNLTLTKLGDCSRIRKLIPRRVSRSGERERKNEGPARQKAQGPESLHGVWGMRRVGNLGTMEGVTGRIFPKDQHIFLSPGEGHPCRHHRARFQPRRGGRTGDNDRCRVQGGT